MVKRSEVGGERSYDGDKKITGRKRHLVVDSLDLLMAVVVTAAAPDHGTGAPLVLRRLTAEKVSRLEWERRDRKHRNNKLDNWIEKKLRFVIEVIKRLLDAKGTVLLPKRWVVEWTFAW